MSTTPENPFIEVRAIMEVQPLDRDLYFATLQAAETAGLAQVSTTELSTADYAAAMHEFYSKTVDLELIPPMTEDQLTQVTGKMAIFGAMREATQPKPNPKKEATPTEAIPTDAAKKPEATKKAAGTKKVAAKKAAPKKRAAPEQTAPENAEAPEQSEE